MNTKIIALYILDQILNIVGAAVALFWSAGQIDWWAAWTAIAVWLAWFTATAILILRFNPDLMAESLRPPKVLRPGTWPSCSILGGLYLPAECVQSCSSCAQLSKTAPYRPS